MCGGDGSSRFLDSVCKRATIRHNLFILMKHKRLILLASSAILALSLSSCGTMRGIGQDISAGGRALSKAAS